MQAAGVQVVVLLALSDDGAPAYDHEHAAALAALGVPAFACTPDLFPDLLAVALRGDDVGQWVSASQVAAPGLTRGRRSAGPVTRPVERAAAWCRRRPGGVDLRLGQEHAPDRPAPRTSAPRRSAPVRSASARSAPRRSAPTSSVPRRSPPAGPHRAAGRPAGRPRRGPTAVGAGTSARWPGAAAAAPRSRRRRRRGLQPVGRAAGEPPGPASASAEVARCGRRGARSAASVEEPEQLVQRRAPPEDPEHLRAGRPRSGSLARRAAGAEAVVRRAAGNPAARSRAWMVQPKSSPRCAARLAGRLVEREVGRPERTPVATQHSATQREQSARSSGRSATEPQAPRGGDEAGALQGLPQRARPARRWRGSSRRRPARRSAGPARPGVRRSRARPSPGRARRRRR